MSEVFANVLLPIGTRCLVLCGDVQESVDGVRVLTNTAIAQGAGESLAYWLLAQGAQVTVVSPKSAKLSARLRGARLIEAGEGARSMLCTLEGLEGPFDVSFQLARIASIRPARSALHKIKAKKEGVPFKLSVEPNADLFKALSRRGPCFGYDRSQTLGYAGPDDFESASWLKRLSVLESTVKTELDYSSVNGLSLFKGEHIVVTSGPTIEPVSAYGDVLTNFSSGRQGYQVAWVLACAGARVSLVTGPATVRPPPHPSIETHFVRTGAQMLTAVQDCLPADGFVGVAAVADFKPQELIQELPERALILELATTADVLRSVSQAAVRPRAVVGFAAETDNLLAYAKQKLHDKGVDVLFANPVGATRAHMNSQLNQVLELTAEGCVSHPLQGKREVGALVAQALFRRLRS